MRLLSQFNYWIHLSLPLILERMLQGTLLSPGSCTEMLNHGKYLAEAFVVSKIIPIFVADKQ